MTRSNSRGRTQCSLAAAAPALCKRACEDTPRACDDVQVVHLALATLWHAHGDVHGDAHGDAPGRAAMLSGLLGLASCPPAWDPQQEQAQETPSMEVEADGLKRAVVATSIC